MIVNIHDAKTQFSKLVQQAAAGEDIVIARAGVPVARLVPYRATRGPRRPGLAKGQIHIADDFDELPDEIAAAFRGERP